MSQKMLDFVAATITNKINPIQPEYTYTISHSLKNRFKECFFAAFFFFKRIISHIFLKGCYFWTLSERKTLLYMEPTNFFSWSATRRLVPLLIQIPSYHMFYSYPNSGKCWILEDPFSSGSSNKNPLPLTTLIHAWISFCVTGYLGEKGLQNVTITIPNYFQILKFVWNTVYPLPLQILRSESLRQQFFDCHLHIGTIRFGQVHRPAATKLMTWKMGYYKL